MLSFYKNILSKLIYWGMALLCISSCKQARKISDIFTNPTPRELYARDLENNYDYLKWNASYHSALADSLYIELPYVEVGKFSNNTFPVYSYDIHLERGEKLMVKVISDSTVMFVDLYNYKNLDSLEKEAILSDKIIEESPVSMTIKENGTYKILLQPELYTSNAFQIEIYTQPSLIFPVAGFSDKAIQSLWGSPRSGGTRLHEGIDIFAPRLTPVIAVTDGYISFIGERGLGGKQVWLRDGIFGTSYYYAHLDSININTTNKVLVGDTLGFIGNTGNARTTAPHLHFGIYTGKGAIDPFPFIRNRERKEIKLTAPSEIGVISSEKANVRIAPNSNNEKLTTIYSQDTIRIMGRTIDWYHVALKDDSKGFIHKSLIKEIDVDPKN